MIDKRFTISKESAKAMYIVLGLLAAMVILIWLRAFYGSTKDYYRGEDNLRSQHYIKAITFFDRSIHWYTPFNPYVAKSAECLWEIGKRAEEQGDIRLALIAYRSIKHGFYGGLSFYSPGKAWIDRCEDEIKKVTLDSENKRKGQVGLASAKRQTSRRADDGGPSAFWSIILEIGLWGWVASTIALIMFGVNWGNRARYLNLRTITSMIIIAVFFGMWVIGMMRA
jgi:hypothetical protein